ncbi:MAG TPA: hypothetical protein VHB49_10550 [Bradyrhizobium sp.]|nr:hypothetical protein [Bradyrhizobium sp.]
MVAALLLPLAGASAQPPSARVDNLRELFIRLGRCWQPPPASRANPIDITVLVSFKRSGDILGYPRITFESEQATDNDRLTYRVAVMEALQRCTPIPFTAGMAGAIAGRPIAIRFHTRKPTPQASEKRAWLIPKTP